MTRDQSAQDLQSIRRLPTKIRAKSRQDEAFEHVIFFRISESQIYIPRLPN